MSGRAAGIDMIEQSDYSSNVADASAAYSKIPGGCGCEV